MAETVNQDATNNAQGQNGTQGQTDTQKTFTQDELNAIVNERLKREREKYPDYAALKEKAEKYDKYEEESKTEIQKMTEKADRLQKELDDIKHAESLREIRAKVAKETGVPENLLSGATEEDCKAQAEAIKAFAKPTYPSVRDGGEPGGNPGVTTAQQFADWFNEQ